MKVTARARSRDDRAGEPLDGLVNLFDLGIVLSLDLTSALTSKDKAGQTTAPSDAVIAEDDQDVKRVEIEPGEKVVGRGQQIGTVYELSDGRTVIVREPRTP